jgi:hypothetical protein
MDGWNSRPRQNLMRTLVPSSFPLSVSYVAAVVVLVVVIVVLGRDLAMVGITVEVAQSSL